MAAAASLLLLLHLLLPPLLIAETTDDVKNLLLIKQALSNVDPSLSSWTDSTSPCNPKTPWAGVDCDANNAIVRLVLESRSLSGSIDVDALSRLNLLRIISFSNNNFSGPIPAFNKLDGLKALFLSHNHFTGQIPDDFFAQMDRLKKLSLSNNRFSGPIPSSLSKPSLLLELYLGNNQFTGVIPAGLAAKFNESSFADNPGLCGPPFADRPCSEPSPETAKSDSSAGGGGDDGGAAAAIIFVAVLVVVLVLVVVVTIARRRQRVYDTLGIENGARMEAGEGVTGTDSSGGMKKTVSVKKRVAGEGSTRRGQRRAAGSGGGGDLVMVNEEKGVLGMADLMKAAAEMLGSGGLGSAYKAVMGNGTAVAVKRMKEMNRVGKEMFGVELRRMGRLRHRNVLPPLAYHYKREEKLLIFEYVPKGSLLYILHGMYV